MFLWQKVRVFAYLMVARIAWHDAETGRADVVSSVCGLHMSARVSPRRLGAASSVAIATVFFLLIGLTLTAIMTHVVGTMVLSADAIDDSRAKKAADAVVTSLKSRLSAITSDNTVWDDAYAASVGDDPKAWAYENWAKTSTDYRSMTLLSWSMRRESPIPPI